MPPTLLTPQTTNHISHLSETQHFHSLTPSHHIQSVLLPHTTTTSLLEISHQPNAFQVQKHGTVLPQPYPIPQAPCRYHLPAGSHSSTLTQGDSCPHVFPPLRTELSHTQQSLPLHMGQTPPIPYTSLSSGGCSHPLRCQEARPAGKQEEFKPAKVGSRG